MKNRFLILLATALLISCSSGKKSSLAKSDVKIEKKGRKMFGEITTYSPKLKEELDSKSFPVNSPELFFKSENDYYLILTSKGNINEEKQRLLINKELKIWGEIIKLTDKEMAPKSAVNVEDFSGYIIIYETFFVK